jgi:predicted alpha-1,6-mannanase (GH76 family)
MYRQKLNLLILAFILFSSLNLQAHPTVQNINQKRALLAAKELQSSWYLPNNGTWTTDISGWWHWANATTALANFMLNAHSTKYDTVIQQVFSDNKNKVQGGFLNDAYDDEGWWALAWIKAYDLSIKSNNENLNFLNQAKFIFNDMTKGWQTHCGGGMAWKKDDHYDNAITTELLLTVAIRLHQRTPGDTKFLYWAKKDWQWFKKSGLINKENLVSNALDDSCLVKNDHDHNNTITWTYNQGVILGGLTDLYKTTGHKKYLLAAEKIASATIKHLTNKQGILTEPCSNNKCDSDQEQFKGIFIRNLAYLTQYVDNSELSSTYRDFIVNNANTIWAKDRNSQDQFGVDWSGDNSETPTYISQTSALDAFNAATLVKSYKHKEHQPSQKW